MQITRSCIPVGGGEKAKGEYEGDEDYDEDDVCPQSTDGVHETKDAHEKQEEGVAGVKGGRRCAWLGSGGLIGGHGVEEWCKCCAKGEPETAKGCENNGRESVAKNPFE